jgi:hypothetical protein
MYFKKSNAGIYTVFYYKKKLTGYGLGFYGFCYTKLIIDGNCIISIS